MSPTTVPTQPCSGATEPTDMAAWLGRTPDGPSSRFFCLSMLPISRELGVPLTAVSASFAVTLSMRPAALLSPAGGAAPGFGGDQVAALRHLTVRE
jgi:hypothetical protein